MNQAELQAIADDAAWTERLAARMALRFEICRAKLREIERAAAVRRAISLGSAAAYRAHARRAIANPNPALADARGITQPGRSHFDSDADYTNARTAR